MTEDQKVQAIKQMIVECDLAYADHYRMVSARSVLRRLGYLPNESQEVIEFIAERGFDYCLDETIPSKAYPDFKLEYPSQDVCWWGPDQLKSRLQSLRGVPGIW